MQNFGGACWKVVRNNVAITGCEHGFKFFLGKRFIAATTGAAGKLYDLNGQLASPAGRTFHSVSCAVVQGNRYICNAMVETN